MESANPKYCGYHKNKNRGNPKIAGFCVHSDKYNADRDDNCEWKNVFDEVNGIFFYQGKNNTTTGMVVDEQVDKRAQKKQGDKNRCKNQDQKKYYQQCIFHIGKNLSRLRRVLQERLFYRTK